MLQNSLVQGYHVLQAGRYPGLGLQHFSFLRVKTTPHSKSIDRSQSTPFLTLQQKCMELLAAECAMQKQLNLEFPQDIFFIFKLTFKNT